MMDSQINLKDAYKRCNGMTAFSGGFWIETGLFEINIFISFMKDHVVWCDTDFSRCTFDLKHTVFN